MAADWPYTQATRTRLAANLAAYARRTHPAGDLRPAAVAIVLAPVGGAAGFLLTRRVARLSSHAGQYALPGGRVDPGEDALAAARRELAEELGLEARPEQLLGALDDLPTRSGYRVTPFVFWHGEQARPTPAPAEIAAVHHVPLADLFAGPGRGGNRAEAKDSEPEPGVVSLYIPTLGHDLFAPTAAILDHFRQVALMGCDSPVVAYGEPRFARR
jgi:8-oxo-dGTP pyrophosphatase MutT (NUDIX family)